MPVKIPRKYLPRRLTRKEYAKQHHDLLRSRRMYKQKKFYTRRTNLSSYPHRTSQHILRARRLYGVPRIVPNRVLAQKTGCSVEALSKIVQKGEGAYYSSGSRPNQTPQSWGLARLASAITGQKAAIVDFDILQQGCHTHSKALRLAKNAKNAKRSQ